MSARILYEGGELRGGQVGDGEEMTGRRGDRRRAATSSGYGSELRRRFEGHCGGDEP